MIVSFGYATHAAHFKDSGLLCHDGTGKVHLVQKLAGLLLLLLRGRVAPRRTSFVVVA